MALTSPGVEVTIIDQSQYLPAATNSVPLVVIATAENKADPAGVAVAPGTTAANAGKLYQVTSQRDLVDLYGTPFFYTTSNGTPIQGYELNEYGLLAAYSVLGATNRCYVLRADIDLTSLVGSTSRPTSPVANNSYWLNTASTDWGIYQFNATTGTFAAKLPIVISDETDLVDGAPLDTIGNIGDYAVVAVQPTVNTYGSYTTNYGTYFYKVAGNYWVQLGSKGWLADWPTVQGTISNPTLTAGETFDIDVNGQFTVTVEVPVSPNNNVTGVANYINNLGFAFIKAANVSGKLNIYSIDATASPDSFYITLTTTDGVLGDLGITAQDYYQPQLYYGTSSQLPLWTSSQLEPHPTGSVWIKVGASGVGLKPYMQQYNSVSASWLTKNVSLAASDWTATYAIDPTGGQSIPANTIYAQYGYNQQSTLSDVYLWRRIALGATVVTGTNTNPQFTTTATITVQVSIPNSNALSSDYSVNIVNGDTASDFIVAWQAANIPYTTVTIASTGALQITHTEGGEIIMDDISNTAGTGYGITTGLITAAGFLPGTVLGSKLGPLSERTFNVAQTSTTSAIGSGAYINVSPSNTYYNIVGSGVGTTGGTNYVVGDTVTVTGNYLAGATGTNDIVCRVASVDPGTGAITSLSLVSGTDGSQRCRKSLEQTYP